ncbi:uncharacterized protein METZ01_LOCUS192614, partial [marine metagenome]
VSKPTTTCGPPSLHRELMWLRQPPLKHPRHILKWEDSFMDQANNGDTVRVHYTGKLEDGTIFDSSEGKAPLEFTIGQQQVIPGFETAVTGMIPG